jgi:L-asparaginase
MLQSLVMAVVLTVSFAGFAEALPTIVLLSTGGTIASKHDMAKGGYVPALTGAELIDAIPSVRKVAMIRVEQISNVSSSDVTPAIWLQLAQRANALLRLEEVAGIVVTHGTNTLEETAYFMDLTVDSDKPVILVGAQRPASDADSDGPRNLLQAVRVAVSPEAVGKGAMVVMNGEINAARDVTKTHTSQVESFRSLEYGQLGAVDEESVRFYRAPLRRQTFHLTSTVRLPRIELISAYAGADGSLLSLAIQSGGIDGFVVVGLGLGGVPSAMVGAIREARKNNIPIVISTRVPTGRIFALAASAGSALSLQRLGCVLADNLNPQKARIMLMLALTQTNDPQSLQKIFNN